ncbi:mitochondrial import receptor subunit TOM40, putative [Hepatocystis sp. ex Piliocolobus tephrosceles]|nr:mitochondrial import receptor subunit TOM40, putative [Hepatocystis sp. ex Piliocolobus tephrosceles]
MELGNIFKRLFNKNVATQDSNNISLLTNLNNNNNNNSNNNNSSNNNSNNNNSNNNNSNNSNNNNNNNNSKIWGSSIYNYKRNNIIYCDVEEENKLKINETENEDKIKPVDGGGGTATSGSGLGSQYPNSFDAPEALLYENLNKEYKYITTQDTFDGFRFEVDKNINKYLQSSHTLILGTTLREVGYLYQFGANFTNIDNTLLMISRINIDGSVNGRFYKKFNNLFDYKFNFNTYANNDTRNMYEMSLEVNKPTHTYNLKTIWQSAWIFNVSYNQLLTKKLQAGVDLTYIASNSASIGSVGLRYNHKNNVLVMQVVRQPNFKSPEFMLNQTHLYKIQYAKKISDRLSVGTELELTPETKESAMRLGWDYTFRHARVQGSIDTSGKISVFTQDYSGLGISGYVDYPNNEYKFGFMVHIMPAQEQPHMSLSA